MCVRHPHASKPMLGPLQSTVYSVVPRKLGSRGQSRERVNQWRGSCVCVCVCVCERERERETYGLHLCLLARELQDQCLLAGCGLFQLSLTTGPAHSTPGPLPHCSNAVPCPLHALPQVGLSFSYSDSLTLNSHSSFKTHLRYHFLKDEHHMISHMCGTY